MTHEYEHRDKLGEELQVSYRYAGYTTPHTAATVQRVTHYSGSGPTAFGGSREWPAVRLRACLPAGSVDLADKLAVELRELLEDFARRHGLDRNFDGSEASDS